MQEQSTERLLESDVQNQEIQEDERLAIVRNSRIIKKAKQRIAQASALPTSFADTATLLEPLVSISDRYFPWLNSTVAVMKNSEATNNSAEKSVQEQVLQILNKLPQQDPLLYISDTKSSQDYEKEPDIAFCSTHNLEASLIGDFSVGIGNLCTQENISTSRTLGRLYSHLHSLLLQGRTHAYGFVCSYSSIIFARMNSDFSIEQSELLTGIFEESGTTINVRYLAGFLEIVKNEAHLIMPKHLQCFRIVEKIGQGDSSIVYKVNAIERTRFGDTSMVLKVKNQPKSCVKSFEDEVTIIQEIIQAKPELQRFLPEIYSSGDNYILMKRMYLKLEADKITVEKAMEFANFLKQMNLLGIYHRDINPDNLMYDPRLNVIKLIDFGYATKKATDKFRSTIAFAADDLLASLKFHLFEYDATYLPRYDMESYFKCLYFIKHYPTSISILHDYAPTTASQFFYKMGDVKRGWEQELWLRPIRLAILNFLRRDMELLPIHYEVLLSHTNWDNTLVN